MQCGCKAEWRCSRDGQDSQPARLYSLGLRNIIIASRVGTGSLPKRGSEVVVLSYYVGRECMCARLTELRYSKYYDVVL